MDVIALRKSAHDERSVFRNVTFGLGVEVVPDADGRAMVCVREDLDLDPSKTALIARAEEIVAAWSAQLAALRSAAGNQ